MRDCTLATTTAIEVYYFGGHLLIAATATVPTPGYDLEIAERPIDIWPPQFEVCECKRGGIWPQPVHTAQANGVFPVGDRPETVVVGDAADHEREIPVKELRLPDAGLTDTAVQPAQTGEAVGLSARLSFDEAFANAVANLPPPDPTIPDDLVTVNVVDVVGLFGGIAGFHHLAVRVRR